MMLDETQQRLRRIWPPLLLLVASALLFLPNLNNHYLWQDEAQTALVSGTILERGLPYGTDGRNFFAQEDGAEYGENYIWRWHTWLSFYLVAGSFGLLGESTFAARLPAVLCGMGSVVLLYYLGLRLWKDRLAAISAAVFLTSSVPFLLLSRQCRYYSLAALLVLLALHAYLRLVARERRSVAYFVGASVLLFHAHYVYCASLLAAVALHCLLFHRERRRVVLVCCGIVALFCAPWIAWLAQAPYTDRYGGAFLDLGSALGKIIRHGRQVFSHVFPPYLLAVPPLLMVWSRIRRRPRVGPAPASWGAVALPLFFCSGTLLLLALTSPAPFFRYLAPLIPPLLALAGLVVATARRLHAAIAAVILLVPLALQPLPDFLYELTHDYDGPIEGVVKFLNEHAAPDDVVTITYGDMPLKFYTDLRVVGGYTGEDRNDARDAKWIIFRRYPVNPDYDRWLQQRFDRRRYRRISLDYPDIPFENRESPDLHEYRTVETPARVSVWERIE